MENLVDRLTNAGFNSKEYDFSTLIYRNIEGAMQLERSNPNEIARKIRSDFGGRFNGYLQATLGSGKTLTQWVIGHLTEEDKKRAKYGLKTKDIVFVIHGLWEKPEMFNRLKLAGDIEDERTLIPLGYDDKKPFENYSREISDEMNRIVDSSNASRVYAIGHSTGSDVLRYLSSISKLGDLSGAVMTAPSTNGIDPTLKDWLLFGDKTDYCNLTIPYGKKMIKEHLQKPLAIPGITLSYLNDLIVPLESSIDLTGRNVVVAGIGHVSGTGRNQRGNRLYLELLNEISNRA